MESMISRLTYLFEVCLNGTCTREEREEYLQLVLRPELQPTLQQLIEEAVEKHETEEAPGGESNSLMLQHILSPGAMIKDYELPLSRSGNGRLRRMYFRIAAAAIILILTGAALWQWLKPVDPPDIKTIAQHNPILPGREGALLTLDDGRVIVLDSLRDGLIGQQGASKVSLKNQQLVYDENKSGNSEVHTLYNTMSTPRGRQFHIRLPDGSIAWLNAASMIRYPAFFKGSTREIEVNGEVYLQVAANPSKPFIVRKKDTKVEVLGTSFNVNAYDDEPVMKITLVEGAVKVLKGNAAASLRPGQQAVLGGENIQVKNKADIDAVTAWKNGLFIMRETETAALMRQISRWYDVAIDIRGTLPNKQFYGIIGMDLPLDDVVKALQSYGINVQLENRKLTILP